MSCQRLHEGVVGCAKAKSQSRIRDTHLRVEADRGKGANGNIDTMWRKPARLGVEVDRLEKGRTTRRRTGALRAPQSYDFQSHPIGMRWYKR